MAPPKKRPSRRQRRNRSDIGLVAAPEPRRPAPPPDRAWLKGTKDRWAAFWGSEVSTVAEPDTDTPALRRLFTYYDELERATRAIRDPQGSVAAGDRVRDGAADAAES